MNNLFKSKKKKKKQDGHNQAANGYNNPSAEGVEEIPLLDLAEFLGVTPDVNPSEDGSVESENDSAQQNIRLIQASVSQHFPKPPSDQDQNLYQHLFKVQQTVRNEVMRLGPGLKTMGLIGCLIDCYHRQTLDHIEVLFKKVQSIQKSFVLMNWVPNEYLSLDVFNHYNQRNAPEERGDFLLLTNLVAKAENLMLENVQKEVRELLDKILLTDRNQGVCDSEESCIGLYKDIIQFIDAMTEQAKTISSKLSHNVQKVCFQELNMFLGRYASEQTEFLRKQAKKAIPNKIHFFKTLKTCKEIKKYVQTKSEGIEDSLIQEIVATLKNMADDTLKLLMEIVADMAESHLQNYFTTKYQQFLLISDVRTHFSKLSWCQDEQKRVMDEAYKLIAHTYLKHLVRSSQKTLRKYWNPDVVQKVIEDAKLLHDTISELAPDVEQWELPELLKDKNIDAVKITVATMQDSSFREDEEFLSTLLEWKGLSRSQAQEVLSALPGQRPRYIYRSFLVQCCYLS